MPRKSAQKKYHRVTLFILLILAFAGAFLVGVYVGFENRPIAATITGVENTLTEDTNTGDMSPFWETWRLLEDKYPFNEAPTSQEKIWGAIEGLTASYDDPYTIFFPPEESKIFEQEINGQFSGVGMEVAIRDERLVVVAPLKDTPAYEAGVQSGDHIVAIDGESTLSLSLDTAVQMIRGPKGSQVTITVEREGESIDITITRDTINIPTLETEVIDDVFVVRLYNFSPKAPELFREAMQELVVERKDKLVIDVRGNPGGYLEASIDIASWFLSQGEVIVREATREDSEKKYRSKGYDIFDNDLEVVILIDEGSASASEILAGALSEHGIATLVGAKTFGKGSVQELVSVTRDTSLKVTVAEWLTPEGVSISEDGLLPDYVIPFELETEEEDADPQLDKALELLLD